MHGLAEVDPTNIEVGSNIRNKLLPATAADQIQSEDDF